MVNINELKAKAAEIINQKKVRNIIGYSRGTHGITGIPALIHRPEQTDMLIWDPTCLENLTRYLVDEKRNQAKDKSDSHPQGIIVKGCDSRALVVLLQEKFIERQDVFIIGVSCEKSGMIDENKLKSITAIDSIKEIQFGSDDHFIVITDKKNITVPTIEIMADRCIECQFNTPVIYDVLLGEKIARISVAGKATERVKKMTSDERWQYWKNHFDRCLRCYACRSVCPLCYCDECVVDSINKAVSPTTTAQEKADKIRWLERSPLLSENAFYHLTRAIHLAGRCIDCGECQRVCPVNIPVRELNKILEEEAFKLYQYKAGVDINQPSLISCFRDDDPQDFIR